MLALLAIAAAFCNLRQTSDSTPNASTPAEDERPTNAP